MVSVGYMPYSNCKTMLHVDLELCELYNCHRLSYVTVKPYIIFNTLLHIWCMHVQISASDVTILNIDWVAYFRCALNNTKKVINVIFCYYMVSRKPII